MADASDILLGGLTEHGSDAFEDKEFPAVEASLGADVAKRMQIQWKTAKEISRDAVLFRNIEPGDARQGGLGDCWLISSIAAVAEFPGVINHLFVDKEITTDGKYSVRIYAPETQTWEVMTVDDRIPCRPGGGPAFAQSVSGEMWVPILEKAYAKFVTSYSKLSGGWPALALEAMTGAKSELFKFDKKNSKVTGLNFGGLTVRKAAVLTKGASIGSTGESHSIDEFWPLLREFDEKLNLMTLASPGKDEFSEAEGPSDDFGIVGGHAYTLIGAKEVEGFKLCNIRNPWGDFEWGGDWSDRSRLWDEHPAVKAALQPKMDKDDGEFWMTYQDMANTFTSVTVNFMNTEMARKPGPPQVDEKGNPTWITSLADIPIDKVCSMAEGLIKEKMGMDIDLDPYAKDLATKCGGCVII